MNIKKALIQYIQQYNSVAVAFSGGVDSTYLAAMAYQTIGENALAITIDTPYIPRWELEEAKKLAKSIGIRHEIIQLDIPPNIENNPENRCYLCKKEVFSTIQSVAKKHNIEVIFDGTNFDDTKDYRPGLRALKELNVKSPLLETMWTKENIRSESKNMKLSTHDKPAYACLLTRLPHNESISEKSLEKIEKAEVFLMELGYPGVRVRTHGELARIEVGEKYIKEICTDEVRTKILSGFQKIGYKYITLDLSGYKMGSFNLKGMNK